MNEFSSDADTKSRRVNTNGNVNIKPETSKVFGNENLEQNKERSVLSRGDKSSANGKLDLSSTVPCLFAEPDAAIGPGVPMSSENKKEYEGIQRHLIEMGIPICIGDVERAKAQSVKGNSIVPSSFPSVLSSSKGGELGKNEAQNKKKEPSQENKNATENQKRTEEQKEKEEEEEEEQPAEPCKSHGPNVRCFKCLSKTKGPKISLINGTNIYGFKFS